MQEKDSKEKYFHADAALGSVKVKEISKTRNWNNQL